MNDVDTVCANTEQEAKEIYRKYVLECHGSLDDFEYDIQEMYQIPDEYLDTKRVWDDDHKKVLTFRQALTNQPGPGPFSSTEY
jgi:hypothetical protein